MGKKETAEDYKKKKEMLEEYEKELKKTLLEDGIVPDKKCKKCYGKGYEGIDIVHGSMILCKCVKKAVIEKKKNDILEEKKRKEESIIKPGNEFAGYILEK